MRAERLGAAGLLALAACGGGDPQESAAPGGPQAPPFVAARVSQRPEFEAIAEALHEGANPYLGYAQVRDLQARVAGNDLSQVERFSALLELCRLHLQFGELEPAFARLDEAEAVAGGHPGARPHLLRMRGLANMRKAEVQNCIQRHNRDCCIFPLAGGGQHVDREPALAARAAYEAYLALQPNDSAAAWLLNVLAMALGDHPGGVLERYRIPAAAFASEADVGRFVDVAGVLGVDPFTNCGGVVAEDLDGDGWIDILASTFDPAGPLAYFRNRGDGTFEDRSAESWLDEQLGGLNLVAGDYDGDGDVDVLVLRGAWLQSYGEIRNSLLRNDGDGTFTDVTRAAGLADPARPSQAAVWADFDGDGDLDLFVGNESSDNPQHPTHYPCQLFRNEGDGTFVDVAQVAGVAGPDFTKGVTAGDYDGDGDMDLYTSNIGPNHLYRNDGDLRFTDVAPALGVDGPTGRSFAPWFFDYDNDGHLDLFVGNYEAKVEDVARDAMGLANPAVAPRLYRNRGDGTFEDVAQRVGLGHAYLPMGANFGDVDGDGWLDLYLATGDPAYETLMPNALLRNDGGRRFQNVTTSAGMGHLQKGHGVAFADFDEDGDQDVYNELGGFYPGDKFRNALFQNPGHGAHHLTLVLRGGRKNRFAVGARVAVELDTPGGPRTLHRAVGSVSSFGGSPLRQELGLGDATAVRRVTVRWPGGTVRAYEGLPLDARVTVFEDRDGFEVERPTPCVLGGER